MNPKDNRLDWTEGLLNPKRRSFLKTVAAGAAFSAASGLVELAAIRGVLDRDRLRMRWDGRAAPTGVRMVCRKRHSRA